MGGSNLLPFLEQTLMYHELMLKAVNGKRNNCNLIYKYSDGSIYTDERYHSANSTA